MGLTENPAALRGWMVAGSELAQMVEEFEGNMPRIITIMNRNMASRVHLLKISYFLF